MILSRRGSLLLIPVLLLLACTREAGQDSARSPASPNDAPPAKRQPITLKDDLGREMTLPAEIRRIVTLAPNLTELVDAVGAGDRLVGTDDASNYPPRAKALPKVGAMQPSIEKIVALKPDVVLASTEGNHPSLAPALAAVNLPLFVVRTDRVEQVSEAMIRLAAVLDSPAGVAKAAELRKALAAQKRTRTKPPRILFAVWTNPLYVAGRETFTGDILEIAGAENAVKTDGWPQYPLESLLATPPDLILYPKLSVSSQQIDALMASAPGLRARAVAVDEDTFTRPGPRIAEAAAELNAILDRWQADR